MLRVYSVLEPQSSYDKIIGKSFRTSSKRLNEKDFDKIISKLISENKISEKEIINKSDLNDYINDTGVSIGSEGISAIIKAYAETLTNQPTNQSTNNTTSSGSSGASGRSSGIMPPHTRFWHLRNIDMLQ